MSFFSTLEQVRPEIEAELLRVIAKAKQTNHSRFPFDDWLLDEATRRVTRGKLMRGGLVIGVYEAYGGSDRRAAVQAAAAIELYGTGLLMQDDVSDRSATRRGLPTIHVAAEQLAKQHDLHDAQHFGENCGIYLADYLFFLAQKSLIQLPIDPKKILAIQSVCAEELMLLGLAQIEDISMSSRPIFDSTITQQEILNMYAGKTGRYSIAWPLKIGAILADAPDPQQKELVSIGEQIGVLFQLRDDELGLFGDPEHMGKSVDDDLREAKKTLYWQLLIASLPQNDPHWKGFGNPDATAQQVEELRTYISAAGIQEQVHEIVVTKQSELQKKLTAIHVPSAVQNVLSELLQFVVNRKK